MPFEVASSFLPVFASYRPYLRTLKKKRFNRLNTLFAKITQMERTKTGMI